MAPEGGVLTLRLAAPHLVSAAAGDGQAPPSQSATAALAQQEEQELHRHSDCKKFRTVRQLHSQLAYL